jgi:hypothetical protein
VARILQNERRINAELQNYVVKLHGMFERLAQIFTFKHVNDQQKLLHHLPSLFDDRMCGSGEIR